MPTRASARISDACSIIGRLLHGEAATAFQIGEVYGRYEAQIGKRRTTRSPSYESGFGGDLRPEWWMTN